MAKQMKGISCCGDCACYSFKKHKCTRGCKDEGSAEDHFYKDCPLPDVVERKRGKWIYADIGEFPLHSFTCPFCGSEYKDNCDGYFYVESFNFCPNCGADMKEDENGG